MFTNDCSQRQLKPHFRLFEDILSSYLEIYVTDPEELAEETELKHTLLYSSGLAYGMEFAGGR
ncbi:hypothetical protein TorRG33x02_252090 [Trema orientale]|uniref:Uncharacterized protein n=1 Tax=Trema orientale TaxID=63057 RepID=A0A2P5DGK4_TREOI|nr:hypothetical protein TorRG33x02_252090 [Trema orientale]